MKATDLGLNKHLYSKRVALNVIKLALLDFDSIEIVIVAPKISFQVLPPRIAEGVEELEELLNELEFDNNPIISDKALEKFDDPISYSDCVSFISPGNYTLQILF